MTSTADGAKPAVPLPACPGCRSGTHEKCDTTAWDTQDDKPVPCACWKANHGG